jgi:hypothetical protein
MHAYRCDCAVLMRSRVPRAQCGEGTEGEHTVVAKPKLALGLVQHRGSCQYVVQITALHRGQLAVHIGEAGGAGAGVGGRQRGWLHMVTT